MVDTGETPRLTYAVVDSGPLIKGLRLDSISADRYVTVPEVLNELRDRQTRHMLATLPVELETREPSSEALDAVRRFAKLTGDLPALSAVDTRVLALAWMCEKEAKGGAGHLRVAPPPPRGRDHRPEPSESDAASEAAAIEEHEVDPQEEEAAIAAMAELALAERRPLGEAMAAEEEEVEEVEEIFDDQPCEVFPGVYIGAVDAAANLTVLQAAGITSILTVADELPTPEAIAASASASASASTSASPAGAATDVTSRLHVALSDAPGASLLPHVPRCVAFIDGALEEGHKVLIHCVAGRARAPAIAAAYLMLRAKGNLAGPDGLSLSASEALARIAEARPWVEVPPGFVGQLEELDPFGRASSMTSKEVDAIVADHVLPKSFIASALSTRREYEASLRQPPAERVALERAARRAAAALKAQPSPAPLSSPSCPHDPPGAHAAAPAEPGLSAEARAAKAAARKRVEAALAAQVGPGGLEEADDLPWVTVENLKATQRTDPNRRVMALDASTKVACLTTDFAMQSVLVQMGLKLMGADGMLMRSVKHWVLRCSGCFTLQATLESQFCSKCGNTSLVRLISILQSNGARRVLPEEGAPARVRSTNVRGTKFPMPKPESGRRAKNLILAEDQLAEAQEKLRRQGKAKVRDVFDPDYSLDDHFGRTKKGFNGGHELKVGYGKRANPNDVRSRPKRT